MELDRERTLSREIALFAVAQGLALNNKPLIAWPAREFDPAIVPGDASDSDGPTENIYLRVSAFPVPPDTRGISSGWGIYQWTQQVSVYIREGIGLTNALIQAEALRQTFPYGRKIAGDEHTFLVTADPAITTDISMDSWVSIPVSIRLQTIT